MRLLVTGRHGQLAQSLARAALGRPEVELLFAARPEVDLAVPGSLGAAIVAARPDVVINAAAFTAVDRAEAEPALAQRINADAAGEAAAAAARVGAAIIQLSTDYVFDGRGDRPWGEDDPTGPVNVYGASKLAGEAQVVAANPRHLVVRTSWIISRFGHNFARTMIRLAADRDEVAVVADQRGCPTEAGALATALLDLAERNNVVPPGLYHLAGGGEASWAELAEAIMAASRAHGGPSANIRPIATADYPTPAPRPRYTVLDCSKARELGLTLPPWREAIDGLVRGLLAGGAPVTDANLDRATVDGFGEEWAAYDQSGLVGAEFSHWFDAYFHLFPFDRLPPAAEGFDLGCGSGRWAAGVAPRVGHLHCIDPAARALDVARRGLAAHANVEFHHASASTIPLADASQDFGYSLGVLHHVPDTAQALADAVRKLKPGAPFLLYLYYRFDQRPAWFRALWRASDIGRQAISRLPFGPRKVVTTAIALGIYWPLSRAAGVAERLGAKVDAMPLAAYRHASLYTLRTDALDRFGTRLEQRFTRPEIAAMASAAGLVELRFSERIPYWVMCGTRA